ncbi:DUF3795 domain-containing protein [Actinomycetota bacterium]
MKIKLIAPCGMNCSLCKAYIRDEKKCPGCRGENTGKNKYCIQCIIKNCEYLEKNNQKYCTSRCKKFPCMRLKNLDKRYRTKYNMSMIDNLDNIEKDGIRKYINSEKDRWIKGDSILCVHDKKYYKMK